MDKAIDWSKILVASEEKPSVFNNSFNCIICDHSVPLNSVHRPFVPICSECRKTIRDA